MIDELEHIIVGTDRANGWPVASNDEQEAGPLRDLQPILTVVIPTRNEAGNIGELVQRIDAALPERPVEIIFVDDSDDSTPATIRAVGAESRLLVRLLHRPAGQRSDGLSGAVLEGLRVAHAEMVAVMDADLQHPPELLQALLARARQTGADVVVGSRYSDSGSVGDFGAVRKAVSTASGTAAHIMFPQQLKQVSDPMSGYFLVRKAALDLNRLQPRGFKILLEILVRTPGLRVAEVGFQFGERFAGESKASLREGARYLSHLWHLRFGEETWRFARFMATGASGLVVNSLLLALATHVLGLQYLLLSALLATQGSSLWNFALTESWVFRSRQPARRAPDAADRLPRDEQRRPGLPRADPVRSHLVAGRTLPRLEPDLAGSADDRALRRGRALDLEAGPDRGLRPARAPPGLIATTFTASSA